MIALAHPYWLILLGLPILIRLLPPRRGLEGAAMRLPGAIMAEARPADPPAHRRGQVLLMLIWGLMCLALAGPERISLDPDRSATGRDIMVALDMSGSMATPDFALDGQTVARLTAVKRVAAGFIGARTGDRIGLVVFADSAYVAAPLTHDLPAVTRALDEAEIGIAGRSTAIAEGLGLALKRMLAEPAETRVIVLLSDGRDTSARIEARDVAALAAENNVRVHTVALGPEDLESRPAARDAVDLATLRAIAEASGGETFRVRSLEDLEAMAAALDRLEPNPSSRPPVARAHGMWIWPAGLALALLLILGRMRAVA